MTLLTALPGTLTPIVRELPADLESPVSVYLKLAGQGPSFLLESVTGGEHVARYSFIGVNPSRAYVIYGRRVEIHALGKSKGEVDVLEIADGRNPLESLREVLAEQAYQPIPGLPRFAGGLVGYAGYELTRYFEPSLALKPHSDLPDAIFLLADSVVAFDHAFGRLLLIGNAAPGAQNGLDPAAVNARLDDIQRRLSAPLPVSVSTPHPSAPAPLRANITRAQYVAAVQAAKAHILAGDIFQVVLSQRLERETRAAPFELYRALRRLNPSPYMFYLDFDHLIGPQGLRLIGASPEIHARLEGRTATLRPIAGTRPRGRSLQEDQALEADLLADPKERAEHVMLVDLGRNDLGRVCRFGSVQVPEQMSVERYSHVMHIVSHVIGELRPELDAFDLLGATFPAGTVSGAPKIRAMQIIAELEKDARGPYAGAVGYFSFDGSMDTCITIRTMLLRGRTVSLQAGAGIVADSEPELEYQETLNKLRALGMAIELAEADETNQPGAQRSRP